MMKTKFLAFIAFIFCALTVSLSAPGETVFSIETGDESSASWQFAQELSRLWKIKYPEKYLSFQPNNTEDIDQRFENLERGDSRMVIAPITFETENYALGKIKIALVLWRVYLIPVDIGHRGINLSFDNYRYIYISGDSLLASTLMDTFSLEFFEQKTRKAYLKEFFPERYPTRNENSIPQLPAETDQDALPEFLTEIIRANVNTPKEIVSQYREGIFLLEMIGSPKQLNKAFNADITWVGLDNRIISEIQSRHQWIKTVRLPRNNRRTLSFKMGLFVSESEDPEFVSEIIELLTKQPHSYFPKSHILASMYLSLTKEISPYILHEASLEHFDL